MNWVLRGAILLVVLALIVVGGDQEYGIWSAAFMLAAWMMVEPRLRPALIVLPVAGLTGIVMLLWHHAGL